MKEGYGGGHAGSLLVLSLYAMNRISGLISFMIRKQTPPSRRSISDAFIRNFFATSGCQCLRYLDQSAGGDGKKEQPSTAIMDPKLFAEKVYLVTGGNRGIGAAVSQQLLGYGAIVYAADIQPAVSDELAEGKNQNLYYVQCDVRDRAACRALIEQVVSSQSRLDGVVNNAGICPLEGERPSDSVFDEVVAVNLTGVWNIGSVALDYMQKQGFGNIVNLGSVSSTIGVPRLPAYTTTKHAVLGLTRTWALDFAKYGIRVNCIAPGERFALATHYVTDCRIRCYGYGYVPQSIENSYGPSLRFG
jgi:NAD(P)-dependent dehydrogenase (short-subunit alcohol dehydrogenase family)